MYRINNTGSMQKIWKQKTSLVPSLLWHFLHNSFPFYFVLSENNLKIISTWLPEKWQMLIHCSWDTMLALNCPRIQCREFTKHNTEMDTMEARGHKTYMCMCHQNIPDWKINKPQHRSRNIYDQIYFLVSWRACLLVQEAGSLLKLKITFRTDSGMHCHQSFCCT